MTCLIYVKKVFADRGLAAIRYSRTMSESSPGTKPGSGGVRSQLQAALHAATKARDTVAVAALRSTLAAIANAETVPAPEAPVAPAGYVRSPAERTRGREPVHRGWHRRPRCH